MNTNEALRTMQIMKDEMRLVEFGFTLVRCEKCDGQGGFIPASGGVSIRGKVQSCPMCDTRGKYWVAPRGGMK